MLNVTQRTFKRIICERLKAMEKIQKSGKWVPHEPNESHYHALIKDDHNRLQTHQEIFAK